MLITVPTLLRMTVCNMSQDMEVIVRVAPKSSFKRGKTVAVDC